MIEYLQKNNRGVSFIKISKSFLFLLLFIVLLVGCTERNNPVTTKISKTTNLSKGNGSTEPYLTGTIIDFWNKSDWSVAKWREHMREMKESGLTTLIIQFTAYNEYLWCYAPNSYSTVIFDHTLPRFLQAADEENNADEDYNQIDVYIGLYFNDSIWNNPSDTSTLQLHATRSKNLASKIWEQYQGYCSFKGWYISQEPAPADYNTDTKFNNLKNMLINPIAQHCKNISGGMPVAISTFFNMQNGTTTLDLLHFMNKIGGCELDVILLQDGTGALSSNGLPHCTINDINSYFNDANWGLYGETPKYTGDFWAITETFTTSSTPETFNNVKSKLGKVNGLVTKIVSFQFFKDMSKDSPHTGTNQAKADTLRTNYESYYEAW